MIKLQAEALFPKTDSLFETNAFTAAMLSDVLNDQDHSKGQEVFKALDIVGNDDKAVVKHVCQVLSERCGFMVAVPMAVFVDRMKAKDHVAIAVTGSLYKHHPTCKALMEKYIAKLVPGRKFHTFLSDDGSGKGAGLVAAIASRINT